MKKALAHIPVNQSVLIKFHKLGEYLAKNMMKCITQEQYMCQKTILELRKTNARSYTFAFSRRDK